MHLKPVTRIAVFARITTAPLSHEWPSNEAPVLTKVPLDGTAGTNAGTAADEASSYPTSHRISR